MTVHCELSDVDEWMCGQTVEDFLGDIPSGLVAEQEITEEVAE